MHCRRWPSVMLYFFIQIRFLQDLKVAHIPPEDVVFFFCWANYFWGSCTTQNYDPWKVTGDELLDLFAKRKKSGLPDRPQPESAQSSISQRPKYWQEQRWRQPQVISTTVKRNSEKN